MRRQKDAGTVGRRGQHLQAAGQRLQHGVGTGVVEGRQDKEVHSPIEGGHVVHLAQKMDALRRAEARGQPLVGRRVAPPGDEQMDVVREGGHGADQAARALEREIAGGGGYGHVARREVEGKAGEAFLFRRGRRET